MSADRPEPTGLVDPPAASRRSRRRFVIGLLGLVAVWSVVIALRWELRAQWWAHKLAETADPQERTFYLTRLASIGDKSLRALPRLIGHPKPANRDAAVTILRHCSSEQSDALLMSMLGDPDPEVAGTAATVLAMRPSAGRYVDALKVMIAADPGSRASWGRTVALGRIPTPPAESALLELAGMKLPPDAKAQVIDSLGLRGSRQAFPILTKAAQDHRPIGIITFSDRSAQRAIDAMKADLLAKGINPAAAMNATGDDPTVASVARKWLRMSAESGGTPAKLPAAPGP